MRDRARDRGARVSPRGAQRAHQGETPSLGNRAYLARLRALSRTASPGLERSADHAAKAGHVSPEAAHARLHAGPRSARAAEALGARAFTIGDDVFLGDGATDEVVRHELEHVAQRRRGETDAPVLCDDETTTPLSPDAIAWVEAGFPRYLQVLASNDFESRTILEAVFSPEELQLYDVVRQLEPDRVRELVAEYRYANVDRRDELDDQARRLLDRYARAMPVSPPSITLTPSDTPESISQTYAEYLRQVSIGLDPSVVGGQLLPLLRSMAASDPQLRDRLQAFQLQQRMYDHYELQRQYNEGVFTEAGHDAYMTAMEFTRTGDALQSPFGAIFYGIASMQTDDPYFRMQAAEMGASFGAPLEAMGEVPGNEPGSPGETEWGARIGGTDPGKELVLDASDLEPPLELASPEEELNAPLSEQLEYGTIDPDRPQANPLEGMNVGTYGRTGMQFHLYTTVEASYGYRVDFDPQTRLPRTIEYDLTASSVLSRQKAPERPSWYRMSPEIDRDYQNRHSWYKGLPFEKAHGMPRSAASGYPEAVADLDQQSNLMPAAGQGSQGLNQGLWADAEAVGYNNAIQYGYVRVRITVVGPFRQVGRLQVPAEYRIEHFDGNGNLVYGVTLPNR